MTPKRYSSEGVILARRNYSEADRILVVFSKNYGKISLLAKGVRKLSSRKRGHLEVFSQIKLSAAKGKSLDILTEAEIINSFPKLRDDLKKVAVAYYLMEAVGKTTREDEPNTKVYELILRYLDKLKKYEKLRKVRFDFILGLLTTLGFWPKEKKMKDPDKVLEEVVEREISSARVGKKLLS